MISRIEVQGCHVMRRPTSSIERGDELPESTMPIEVHGDVAKSFAKENADGKGVRTLLAVFPVVAGLTGG
jgi:hypothetical protein